jgi:hypothetical protein
LLAAERRDRAVPLALLGLLLESLERRLSQVEPLPVAEFERLLGSFHFRIEILLTRLDDERDLAFATEELAAAIRDELWTRPS